MKKDANSKKQNTLKGKGKTENPASPPTSEQVTSRGVWQNPATQFKPGQSGNPGGRPKRKPLTAIYQKIAAENPELLEAAIRESLQRAGMSRTFTLREMGDRIEGKVPSNVNLTGDMKLQTLAQALQAGRQRVAADRVTPELDGGPDE